MKLSLKPTDIPFMVGDLVWVAQSCGTANLQAYFQGQIMQIILDGTLKHSKVIRQRKAIHELLISSVIYDIKPVGDHDGVPRMSVDVELFSQQTTLFPTQKDLLAHQLAPV